MLNTKTEKLHKKAMELSDKAILALKEGRKEDSRKYFLKAAFLEEKASYDRSNFGWHQPYSYSAACLFISAGENKKALEYIEKVILFIEDKHCLNQLNEAKEKAKQNLSYSLKNNAK